MGDRINRYTQTMASLGTLAATGVDLGANVPTHVYLQIPAIASGSTRVQFSDALAGTYKNVTPIIATANVAELFTIDSTITNCIVEVPYGGRYAKVESTSGVTNTVKEYVWITVFK
jgi:hypothetical protein